MEKLEMNLQLFSTEKEYTVKENGFIVFKDLDQFICDEIFKGKFTLESIKQEHESQKQQSPATTTFMAMAVTCVNLRDELVEENQLFTREELLKRQQELFEGYFIDLINNYRHGLSQLKEQNNEI